MGSFPALLATRSLCQIDAHSKLILSLTGNLVQEPPQNIGLAGKLIQLGRSQATLLDNPIQTSQLLGSIPVALAQLLEHAEIVLGILVLGLLLERLGLLLSLGGRVGEGCAASELGHNAVENLDGAGLFVQNATHGAVRAGLLVHEGDERGLVAAAAVVLGRLAAFREVLDGWVRGDTLRRGSGLAVRGFGVDLGDQHVGFVGEVGGEGLPCWSEALAVWVGLV